MAKSNTSRRHHTDLLVRPPWGARTYEQSWSSLIVDRIEQLRALADLLTRGLLSPEEYEQQKAKVIDS